MPQVAQAIRYQEHLKRIMAVGITISPRGEEVKEIGDQQLVVDPRYPFMSFPSRRYPLNYFKQEMKWKLGANPYDRSIEQHAKMWEQVRNPDGTFNSNYGQYWFGPQGGLWSVVTELIRDRDSRRAVIPMLRHEHTQPHVKDTVCTEAVGFRIRGQELYMSVHMRSSDAIFGLGTDVPTFAFLYRLVMALVGNNVPGGLSYGSMVITAMSSHIYQRHYEMAGSIIRSDPESYEAIHMPRCSFHEAMYLVSSRGKLDNAPDEYLLAKWLAE